MVRDSFGSLVSFGRRHFLRAAASTAAALAVSPALLLAENSTVDVTVRGSLKLGTGQPGPEVPPDFIGLSYENMQLEDPGFFSPANTGLIRQFRAMAPRGVLRLGGNTSEFGWWQATPGQAAPVRSESPWKAAGEPTAATVFAITPEAIRNLNGFLQATGWSCIYGLNLGYGTPQVDVAEALFVAQTLGPRLEYFQVGNEVDLFKGHLRDPATWNVERYLEQWLTIARAVQKALPDARFGLPDVAADVTWLPQIAALWAAVPDKPKVVTMSHHYYWSGPPENPRASVENLLKTDPKVAGFAKLSSEACRSLGPGVRWRMTEGNTVYRGGKDGVSDVFASALWGADYLLQLMSLGYCGVNLHGGSGHAQAVSVGGVFHGEALMKDPNVPHPKPFYTPIANEGTLAGSGVNGKLNANYLLEPVGYGMQFVAPFAGGTLLPLEFASGGVNATAYAVRRGPDVLAIVLNKDASQPLRLEIEGARVVSRLEAPALESREAYVRRVADRKRNDEVLVPAHSGVLLSMPG